MYKKSLNNYAKKMMILSTIIFLLVCSFTYILGRELNIKKSLAVVHVTKVKVKPSSETIRVGGTISLFVILEPSTATDKTIKWSSSNNSVATVNSKGVVTGKSIGKVTITATSTNGVKGTATIQVQKGITPTPTPTPIPVEPSSSTILVDNVEIKPKDLSINVGESFNLSVIITPDDATDKSLIWDSSDSSIVEVDSDGVIIGKKVGKATITVKSSNDKIDSTIITVKEIFSSNEEPSFIEEPSSYTPEEPSFVVNTKLLIIFGILLTIFIAGAITYFVVKSKKANYI